MIKRILFSIICLLCSSFILTDTPTQFHESFSKLYPQIKNVDWSQGWNFYIATFTNNGFETKVWMNNSAQWIMTVTDLETTDELPSNVYTVFMFTQYSQWNVTNVYSIEFPKYNKQYVIVVNMDNSSSTYQIFFEESGKVLNIRNVTYISKAIVPEIFGFNNN